MREQMVLDLARVEQLAERLASEEPDTVLAAFELWKRSRPATDTQDVDHDVLQDQEHGEAGPDPRLDDQEAPPGGIA